MSKKGERVSCKRTDNIDQISRKHTTNHAISRWPVSTFYTFLDITAIDAYTLHMGNLPSLELIKPQLKKPSKNLSGLELTPSSNSLVKLDSKDNLFASTD